MAQLKSNRLPRYDRESIAWNYHAGFTIDQLAEEYNVDRTCVVYWGRKRNIVGKQYLHNNKLTKLRTWDKDLVAWNHFCGYRSGYIADQYKIDRTRVWQILKEKNVKIHRVDIDDTVFNEINKGSAYWIGFLVTDGCVVVGRSHTAVIEICLAIRDYKHLVKFRIFMKSNAKIFKDKKKCSISLTSEKLANILGKYGIVPNKTPIAFCPDEFKFNSDFWRGAIDGDGCIYNGISEGRNTYGIHFCGTKELVSSFSDYANSIIGHSPSVKRVLNGCENFYESRIQGKYDVYGILCDLYEDSAYYLDRKKYKAISIINKIRYGK